MDFNNIVSVILMPCAIGYSAYLYRTQKYILALVMSYVAGLSSVGILAQLLK